MCPRQATHAFRFGKELATLVRLVLGLVNALVVVGVGEGWKCRYMVHLARRDGARPTSEAAALRMAVRARTTTSSRPREQQAAVSQREKRTVLVMSLASQFKGCRRDEGIPSHEVEPPDFGVRKCDRFTVDELRDWAIHKYVKKRN